MEIILIRHGKTSANNENRYNGRTDDPLSAEGLAEVLAIRKYPEIPLAYVSPLLRARQTADVVFPNAEKVVVQDLREMDFGDFEGRTAEEMEHDPDYRAWVASECVTACPNGESIPSFAKRAAGAFALAVMDAVRRGETRVGVAVHGGVIMAIMSAFAHAERSYFDWYVLNGGGYVLTIDEASWASAPGFVSYERFGELGDSRDMLEGETK